MPPAGKLSLHLNNARHAVQKMVPNTSFSILHDDVNVFVIHQTTISECRYGCDSEVIVLAQSTLGKSWRDCDKEQYV